MHEIHPSNLANRESLEQLNNSICFGLQQVQTLAEIICHTATAHEDLFFADVQKRAKTLLTNGYIELVSDQTINSNLVVIKPEMMFKLTKKGREMTSKAMLESYLAVDDLLIRQPSKDHLHGEFQQTLIDARVQAKFNNYKS